MSTPTRPRPTSTGGGRLGQTWAAMQRWLDAHPGADYLIIRSVIFLLTGIGVVMVMSSSMTWSVIEGSTVWGQSIKQGVMVVLGLVAFWMALRIRPRTVRRLAPWLVVIAVVLLIAVLIPGIGTGRESVGSQSWIILGPATLQPSEFAKVAVAVWGAQLLSEPPATRAFHNYRFQFFAGVAAAMTILIALQGDLGMAVSFSIVWVFLIFFAGVDYRWIAAAGVAAFAGLIAVFLSGGFRSHRFHVYFDALFGRFEDTRGTAFQSYQGFLSLADGSATGVGLGQSRAKWFYLPEAKNDFIFAVIGEELGWFGGALVIILFALLGIFGLRAAMRAQDRFQSLMAATLTAGVVSQAFINIGYVVGLLPVTGIQLPMISAGGTSAIITLGSMGLLASVARHEPEAVSAMQSYGRPLFDRALFLPEPTVLSGADGSTARSRRAASRPSPEQRERFGSPVTGSVKGRNPAPPAPTRRRGAPQAPHHDRRR
ncbi:cell division protein FtsW [Corynebacterium testudinoris]|uniref:Probable peptidoglycan glycosyltransferase FtsW n=1 Tax=Corynebacterium testudinoris TaxID=136857 RepID=A0A0G3H761_9CORY|nr:putative peptidoglycan glycosyltransferase FtsW [Corynebacterium testudinoris]AKK09216.1 bacterial cell division membrane protein [Corynebacterium testudinoris]MBX8996001.1 cell division protein FtsW [Corynebacterium testudinoris]